MVPAIYFKTVLIATLMIPHMGTCQILLALVSLNEG
jgi:hypothetical protein